MPPVVTAHRFEDSAIRRTWRLARPFWTAKGKGIAYGLLVAVIGLNLVDVLISVLINKWRNGFYDSLQNYDMPAFKHAILKFCLLAFIDILAVVYGQYLTQMLQIRWRRHTTEHLLSRWLARKRYYRLQLLGNPSDNPDQRIAEDVNQFTDGVLSLSLGMLSSVVTLASFLTILWGLSGPLAFTLAGHRLVIPGYMLWAAILYAFIGTWVTIRIGRPLIGLTFSQQRFEANFRYGLVRLRESGEAVALYHGEAEEDRRLLARFRALFDNYRQIMKRQKRLSWFTSGYGQAAVIFPYVVAAPAYFAKTIKLGGLMQTASAFIEVQRALSYIITSYTSIAALRAVIDRLSGFDEAMIMADRLPADRLVITESKEPSLRARFAAIALPDGSVLHQAIDLALLPGESWLITGPSGAGKSTLLRALAGIWPFAEGRIERPANVRMLFLPQKPYLPLGSLREVLAYPGGHEAADGDISALLDACRLSHLLPHLDEDAPWAQRLSPGEQQRLAFAQCLWQRPDFVFLDEATAALDEATEAQLYALLRQRLSNATIVSVGHRESLKQWHDQRIEL